MSATALEPAGPPKGRRDSDLIEQMSELVKSTHATMERISARLDRLETRLSRLEPLASVAELAEQAPAILATVTDMVDERIRSLQARGIDLDARVEALGELAERLTEPDSVRALGTIMSTLPALAKLVTGPLVAEETLDVLSKMAHAIAATRNEPVGEAGLFKAWRATRKPEMKRALDFALRLGTHLGAELSVPMEATPAALTHQATEVKALPAPGGRS